MNKNKKNKLVTFRINSLDKRDQGKPINTSLGALIGQIYLFDMSPPYQRGDVWDLAHKQALIVAILKGTPINTLHLVQKNISSAARYVLDGRQRLTAIKDFINNEFSIKVEMEEGKACDVKYKNFSDDKYAILNQKFNELQISLVIYPPMDMEDQRDIFNDINYSEPLSNEEKIYCGSFITRNFLNCILQEVDGWQNHFHGKKILANRRFEGTAFVHSLMIVAFGNQLDDKYAPRDTIWSTRGESAKKLEEIFIKEEKWDANTLIDKKLIEKSSFSSNFELLNNAVKMFREIINFKNNLSGKKFELGTLTDLILFFIKKQQENIFTYSYVMVNKSLFFDFIEEYVSYKNLNRKDLKSSTARPDSYMKRMSAMEDIMKKYAFDLNVKNKNIPNNSKLIALMNASPTCPIDGSALREDNLAFDHVQPKSIYSDSKVAILSANANLKKSNLTEEELEKNLSLVRDNILKAV